jgi:propane monooxygenase reductase component
VGNKHRVRFEPVGIEIEADEDETILDAAFRQGLMLMHGCKEGQCSACKSFLLEGEEGIDVELDRYSTFALPDFEKDEGYVLLCRAHTYDDLTIELINFDEDMLRTGVPIQHATAEVEVVESVTHDLRRLVLKLVEPPELAFVPGQYVDLYLPGTDGLKRSFSMASTPATDDRLEFVIKVYPDGAFSHLLDKGLSIGDRLELKGPYGLFTLREGRTSDVVMVGGGAGMAPILSLLRSMAERGMTRRAVYYYGARRSEDLCFLDELTSFEQRLPGFRYIPALSEPAAGTWDGETGLITDVVDRLEGSLAGSDAYVCGPPPMVEAAMPVLERHGVATGDIHYDKFTTTGAADGG